MEHILVAWLGNSDIAATNNPSTSNTPGEQGPLRTLTDARNFDILYLLYTGGHTQKEDAQQKENASLVAKHVMAGSHNSKLQVEPIRTNLADPTDHTQIYDVLSKELKNFKTRHPHARFTLHLTPGTPAMHAVMLAISKQGFEAEAVRTVEKTHATQDGKQIFTVHFPMGILGESAVNTATRETEYAFIPALEEKERPLVLGRVTQAHKVNILLLGETGVGKSHIAKHIHRYSGRKGEMVTINCAGLTESIVESELFGHEKGAFTGADTAKTGVFEQANGSTLFLDEIGELPLLVQAKLLRVIQERKIRPVGGSKERSVDVRLVCATNINLMDALAKGTFRPDLYHRIAHYEVRLRPFREYAQKDKERMIAHLLAEIPKTLTDRSLPYVLEEGREAMRLLCAHYWPGNIRQIEFALLQLCLVEDGNTLLASTITRYLQKLGTQALTNAGNLPALALCMQCAEQGLAEGVPLDNLLASMKQHAIELALRKTGLKKTAAAKLLGVPLNRLNYALK